MASTRVPNAPPSNNHRSLGWMLSNKVSCARLFPRASFWDHFGLFWTNILSLSHTFTHLCILIDIFISRFAKKKAPFFIFLIHSLAYLNYFLYLCARFRRSRRDSHAALNKHNYLNYGLSTNAPQAARTPTGGMY